MVTEKRGEEKPGMRLVELWVPDLNDPVVAQEFRRQVVLASQGEDEKETLNFIDSVNDWDDI